MITITSKAALFKKAGEPLEMINFNLPGKVEPNAALCKVVMSTICGSDLHTISGRRKEPSPLILGHEIIGRIVDLGGGLEYDGFGNKLKIGDRVTWTIMASCNSCFYCKKGLPQKCENLIKYGHSCFHDPPHLTGGYSEYIYLYSGTTVFKIPESIPDEVATPANCALSTTINAIESIGLQEDESVLIQGAGLLGLNLIALAIEAGAKKIIVTDILPKRLALAKRFGAHVCLNLNELSFDQVVSQIRSHTGGYGADIAIEVCGANKAVPQAVEALRTGGRYLIAGLVTPGSHLGLDGNQLTRKCLTVRGIHNYHPKHLGMALKFLEEHAAKYPYQELVGTVFPLSKINEAIETAMSGDYVRVGIRT